MPSVFQHFVLVALFLASICGAQTGAADANASTMVLAQGDPKAIAILRNSIRTCGISSPGLANTQAQGSITINGKIGSIVVKTLGTNHVKNEVSLNDSGPVISILKQGSGSTLSNGKQLSLPFWVSKYAAPEHIPALSRINDFARTDFNVVYVGLEKFNGVSVHHIRLFKSGTDASTAAIEEKISDFHVFIDEGSLLTVKTQSYIFSPETPTNSSTYEIDYSDYRKVSGAQIPFHQERFVAGQKVVEISFDQISLAANNTEADFQ